MAILTKKIIDFCIDAYRCLKDETSEKASFIKYRDNEEKYIDFIMQKKSYYFGAWALFETSVYVMSIDETLLKQWYDDYEKSRIAKTQVKMQP